MNESGNLLYMSEIIVLELSGILLSSVDSFLAFFLAGFGISMDGISKVGAMLIVLGETDSVSVELGKGLFCVGGTCIFG